LNKISQRTTHSNFRFFRERERERDFLNSRTLLRKERFALADGAKAFVPKEITHNYCASEREREREREREWNGRKSRDSRDFVEGKCQSEFQSVI